MGLACFHPSGLSIILENNSEGQKEQRRAQAPFLYIAAAVCEEPAVIFTAPGLLAISFCIDPLSKAIDYQAAAQVCEATGRKTENPSPPEIYVSLFPLSKQLRLPGHPEMQTSRIEAWI